MSKIKIKTINGETIEPIEIKHPEKDQIKGYSLFPEIYANIFLVAKKKSGKSTTIYNIVKKCTDNKTKFVIIASTINKDPTYIHMIKYLEKRGNVVIPFQSITEGKINNLEDVFKMLYQNDDTDSEDEQDYPFKEIQERKKRKKKAEKISPELFFIFDDLSKELQNKFVSKLLKENRHHKSKVIISSQWMSDLRPEARRQLDYCLLFKGHTADKLEKIYLDLDLAIGMGEFIRIYKHATETKYNFLYIDATNGIFRKNFNKEYEIQTKNNIEG